MKLQLATTAAALTLFASTASWAQATGAPAFAEAEHAARSHDVPVVANAAGEPGPYARYLMSVNGVDKAEAIRQARTEDGAQRLAAAKFDARYSARTR